MLAVSNLTVYRDSQLILNDICFQADAGETLAILGPAGRGKSVLLRCLAGLDAAQSGNVAVNGHVVLQNGIPLSPRRMKRVRLQIGFVFQKLNLFPHLTTMENLTVPYRMVTGCGRVQAELECNRFLKAFDLRRAADLYPTAVSDEERQRIAVARALLFEPQLVLLDDLHTDQAEEAVQLADCIRNAVSGPVTIVAATRYEAPACALTDRVLTITPEGRLVQAEQSFGE